MWWFYLTLVFLVLLFIVVLYYIYKTTREEMQAKIKAQKHQLTNNIAHEIRTPVASIRGYLETLSEMPDMDKEHRTLFIKKAYNQSIKLSNLISDISLITRLEQEPYKLTKEYIPINKVIEDIKLELKDKISELGVNFVSEISDYTTVKANPALLYSVFRNLIENSLRYAGRDFTINISCLEDASEVIIRYYDTGKGVESKELDKIFERFYRVKGASSNSEGSGLGLSIVKNAVEFHGGKIKVKLHKPSGLEYNFNFKK